MTIVNKIPLDKTRIVDYNNYDDDQIAHLISAHRYEGRVVLLVLTTIREELFY